MKDQKAYKSLARAAFKDLGVPLEKIDFIKSQIDSPEIEAAYKAIIDAQDAIKKFTSKK